MIRGDDVVYVGVGAGQGTARYPNSGLGQRLHWYWRRHKTEPSLPDGTSQYEPTAKWRDHGATAIMTVGFPPEYSYLAYALEQYLIRELSPELITLGKRKAQASPAG